MSKLMDYLDNLLNRDKKTLEYTQNYWKTRHPDDNENSPKKYVENRSILKKRSEYLHGLVEKYCSPNFNIIELGCNAGRNLNHLYESGYRNLTGLEINPHALDILRNKFPDMAEDINLILGSIEDNIELIPNDAYELVYTMAVLQHVHYDSDWIFSEISRICSNKLILIESSANDSWRHYPRDFPKIFKENGFDLIFSGVPEGFGKGFTAEVYSKLH